ncbi:MAG TPA: hypothetical protein VGC89_07435 [Pyrinomonadaceae bacterium]
MKAESKWLSKWLPNRRDVNTFFYAGLEILGDLGWGFNEALNVIIFMPAITFTIGWGLGELWATRLPYWEALLGGLFSLHLISGVIWFIKCSRNASSLPKTLLRKRAKITLVHVTFGYVVVILFTLVTTYLVYATSFLEPQPDTINGRARSVISLIIITYVTLVFFSYRLYPAIKTEGGFGLAELFLWTLFINVTGGCQSHFFYLYFLTLIPVFRRGLADEAESQLRPTRGASFTATSWLKRKYIKHNERWHRNVIYPFLWLTIVAMIGATSCMWWDLSGICNVGLMNSHWLLGLVVNFGRFYLNSGPWLVLLIAMAVMMEIETDSLRILGQLMKRQATEEWTKDLREVVAELGLTIRDNYLFRCSGVLAIPINVYTPAKGPALYHVGKDGKAFQLDNIYDIKDEAIEKVAKEKVRAVSLKVVSSLDAQTHSMLQYLQPDGANKSTSISELDTGYFYYLNEANEQRRFKEFIDPLKLSGNYENSFWHDACSLCYVILSHPPRRDSGEDISYTVVFFKAKLPGEFDSAVTKLYEALFTQVVGLFQKYELYRDRDVQAQLKGKLADEREIIADLAMTLTHDFKKQADHLYIKLGKTNWMNVAPRKAPQEQSWSAQLAAYLLYRRLALVDGIARYQPRNPSMQLETELIYKIRNEPSERTLPVLKAIAQGCWIAANFFEGMKLNTQDVINGKSWEVLGGSKLSRYDDWVDVVEAFFSNVQAEGIEILGDAEFICVEAPVGDTIDVVTDLWVLVFHELARNSVKGEIPSKIRVNRKDKEGDKLTISWTSYFEGGEAEARKQWGDKESEFPPRGKWKGPGKPRNPGRGWGQYGNFVVVHKLLGQKYEVRWDLDPEQELFYWTTRFEIEPPIIRWSD